MHIWFNGDDDDAHQNVIRYTAWKMNKDNSFT